MSKSSSLRDFESNSKNSTSTTDLEASQDKKSMKQIHSKNQTQNSSKSVDDINKTSSINNPLDNKTNLRNLYKLNSILLNSDRQTPKLIAMQRSNNNISVKDAINSMFELYDASTARHHDTLLKAHSEYSSKLHHGHRSKSILLHKEKSNVSQSSYKEKDSPIGKTNSNSHHANSRVKFQQ